jgi:hypothetical protein
MGGTGLPQSLDERPDAKVTKSSLLPAPLNVIKCKLEMSSGAIRRTPRAAADLHGAVVRFLSSCTEPALLDPGEPLLPLDSGNYCLEMRGGRLIFEAWDNSRNLVRRVIDITGERRGRLELQVEKFGGRAGKLWLVDRTASHDLRSDRDAARFGFRERFRRFLRREFPGRAPAPS